MGQEELEGTLVGRVIHGYELVSQIGSGATGVVYAARRPEQERRFAVKVIHEALGHMPILRGRFAREARALAKLSHERVVEIIDVGVEDDLPFIVMEHLEGQTLEDALYELPLAPDVALEVTRQVLEALAFAHEREIVHRDLKPANIFLLGEPGDAAVVKVLDFGLAKFLSAEELDAEGTLTRKGRVVGTPAYMAPEQISGISLDVRADIYACGVLLYELLADRRPFDYDRRSQLLKAHLFEPVPRMADVRHGLRVAPELEDVVRRALAKDPTERFANGAEMLAALAPFGADDVEVGEPSARSRERSTAGTSSVIIEGSEREALTSSVRTSADGGVAPVRATTTTHWSEARWVGALVWTLGLLGLAAVVLTMWYATTLR